MTGNHCNVNRVASKVTCGSWRKQVLGPKSFCNGVGLITVSKVVFTPNVV